MKHSRLVSIDISDSSIKILELDKQKCVLAYASGALKEGVVNKGLIVDQDEFRIRLHEVLRSALPQAIDPVADTVRSVICLPESMLYTHYTDIPTSVRENEVREFVLDDAQKSIPYDLKQMYADFHVHKRNGVRSATFVCALKTNLDNYVDALTKAEARPAFISSELLALGRGVKNNIHESFAIIDIGGQLTTIGLFGNDAIPYVSIQTPIAGKYFTDTLMERLSLSEEEAHRVKREADMGEVDNNGKVTEVLGECIRSIIGEFNDAHAFYTKKTGDVIGHIALAGGSALIPNIAEFIHKETGIQTEIGMPFGNVTNPEIFGKETPRVLFSTVIGLASLAESDVRTHINLLTQYEFKDTNVRTPRSLDDIRLAFTRFTLRLKERVAKMKRVGVGPDGGMPSRRSVVGDSRRTPLLVGIFFLASCVFFSLVVIKYVI